ncbi:CG9870, partial [Drosophila busckii]
KHLSESSDSFRVILPPVIGFVWCQMLWSHLPARSWRRFLLEFLLIGLPSICTLTVANRYLSLYCVLSFAGIAWRLWRSGWSSKVAEAAKSYSYELGRRPIVFTLLRATAYTGTCVAILAVDFEPFPKGYRKSRTFGAAVMDMGIGLFVVTMGMVSQRARYIKELKKVLKVVTPLLLLGLARTLVIAWLDYQQDACEYGKHLNAFFILGMTKLLGSVVSLLARNDRQLLPLSLGLLLLHELVLQCGLSQYVISWQLRKGFYAANREGLSSLPGCIALYLFSIYVAKWYTARNQLNFNVLCSKWRQLLIVTCLGWLSFLICVFVTGIARVTFNAGYVIWIMSTVLSLLLIFSFFFEFALQTPLKQRLASGDAVASKHSQTELPVFVETLNMNGLTHFMISNLLTGFVNMALSPDKRSATECVIILSLYVLATSVVVFLLYLKRIRIA